MKLFNKKQKISISYTKTFNLGNYESEKIGLTAEYMFNTINNLDTIIDVHFKYLQKKVHQLHQLHNKKI